MRNKIFVLTEDLQFFYRINKELDLLKIKFKILNFWNKIPKIASVVLTTSKEVERMKKLDKDITNILPYSEKHDFNYYILKILVAHKIGIKENYSELIFSIDPGTKHFGLVIFLDDYFIFSYTFNEKVSLLNKVKAFSETLQKKRKELPTLTIKIGSGVIPTTIDLIKTLFSIFDDQPNMRVLLVDEVKSSKINIYRNKKRFPKHEASALILALRHGIEIKEDFQKELKKFKTKSFKKEALGSDNIEIYNENKIWVRETAERMLNGEIPLSICSEMVREHKEIP